MARGLPAIWSCLLGLPFLGTGVWLYIGGQDTPAIWGAPFIGFGLFIIIVGAYVHFVSPSSPRLADDEKLIEQRHPTQRVAYVKIGGSVPVLLFSGYLYLFTLYPYVYPTGALLIGLYTFSDGLHTFWANSLTTYYLSNERVIHEYRFLSLRRHEIPRKKIRSVQERKSPIETLVGLGNVVVASGGGKSLEIRMQNMRNSEQFADEIRKLL